MGRATVVSFETKLFVFQMLLNSGCYKSTCNNEANGNIVSKGSSEACWRRFLSESAWKKKCMKKIQNDAQS